MNGAYGTHTARAIALWLQTAYFNDDDDNSNSSMKNEKKTPKIHESSPANIVSSGTSFFAAFREPWQCVCVVCLFALQFFSSSSFERTSSPRSSHLRFYFQAVAKCVAHHKYCHGQKNMHEKSKIAEKFVILCVSA